MGGTQSSSSSDYDAAPVDYDAVISDALTHGWILEQQRQPSGVYELLPPRGFECRGWGAVWEKVSYNGYPVSVPTYALLESVRRTGTR
jgi:hypothetical protein